MNEVSIAAITKGRSLEDVLNETMRIYNGAKKAVEQTGVTGDKLIAKAIEAAAYRLYLLGVQDGMEAK